MSRSLKVNRHTFEKVPDKTSVYKCHCSWCIASKQRYKRIGDDLMKQGIGEIDLVEVKRRFIDDLDIPSRNGSPRRVDIDLSKALRKIKLRLKNSP